jgi:oligo-1,6-glucosidase
VSRFGDDGEHWRASATALATVLHLHRGTPYVYQGEEIGMTNAPFSGASALRDVESLNHYHRAVAAGAEPDAVMGVLRAMGRDNARTPVQWDASPQAGFTTATPWIAVNPNHAWLNAATQYDDPRSVFHHYRRLIALRHTMPVVAHGTFTMLLPEHPQVYAYERRLDDARLVVVANLSGEFATIGPDLDLADLDLILTNADRPQPAGNPIELAPWEAHVYATP